MQTRAHSLSLFPYTVYMCVSSCISPCVQSPGQASSLSPQPAGSLHQPVSSLSRTMLACNPTLEANEMQHRQSALQHLLFVWAFFFFGQRLSFICSLVQNLNKADFSKWKPQKDMCWHAQADWSWTSKFMSLWQKWCQVKLLWVENQSQCFGLKMSFMNGRCPSRITAVMDITENNFWIFINMVPWVRGLQPVAPWPMCSSQAPLKWTKFSLALICPMGVRLNDKLSAVLFFY